MTSVPPSGSKPVPPLRKPSGSLLKRWAAAWLARAEQRWRASAPPYSRYY
jgi:hypothetical protein